MINSLYLPELYEMLALADKAGLAEFCTALHPGRTAEFMEGLTSIEMWDVLRHSDMNTRVAIFGFLEEDRQVEILENIDRAEIAQLIDHLPADDRVDLLNEVEPVIVQELMVLIPQEDRRDILRLGSYEEETAGSVMTSAIAKLPETMRVGEALAEVSRQASELETIYYVYLTDNEDHLRGVVSCRQLISHSGTPNLPIREIMERDLVTVEVTDDQEIVAEKVARYDMLAIPVVDSEHHLLGIVTHDDVIDVVREEATEDAHRISAVEPLKESYLESGLIRLIWNRGIWLVILFIGALLTALALQTYESDLERISWLVLFIPLVISSGGNSGSQSATLIITALTLGDVKLRDWARVMRRELVMGVCLGGFLALIGFVAAYWLRGSLSDASVIPITILLVVICGTLVGSLLPLIFRRLGLDPAMMSNPFIAGIIDIVGIVIYMRVALAILDGGG